MPGNRGFLGAPRKGSNRHGHPPLRMASYSRVPPTGGTPQCSNRPHLGSALRLAVLRREPDRPHDRRDQRPASRTSSSAPATSRRSASGRSTSRPRTYLDRLDCARPDRRPGQPRLAQRRLRPLRGAVRRAPARAAQGRHLLRRGRLVGARPRPRRRSAAAATRGSASSSPSRPTSACSSCTTTCCRSRAPGASATSCTTRATRSRCSRTSACRLVLSGHKHVPVRLAARGPVRRQRRHRLDAAPAGQGPALLQHRRDRRTSASRRAQVPVPRAGADHRVLDRHARVREVHGPHRARASAAEGARADRRRARAGRRRETARVAPYEVVAAVLLGSPEKLRERRTPDYGVPRSLATLADDLARGRDRRDDGARPLRRARRRPAPPLALAARAARRRAPVRGRRLPAGARRVRALRAARRWP